MNSSSTIRTCSKIMMVIAILASAGVGIALISIGYDFFPIIGIAVIVVGCFFAILMNALFQGFADIIDNTYAVAMKTNGVAVSSNVSSTGDVSFQQVNKVAPEKAAYADDLLAKGLISQEEHDRMIGGQQ